MLKWNDGLALEWIIFIYGKGWKYPFTRVVPGTMNNFWRIYTYFNGKKFVFSRLKGINESLFHIQHQLRVWKQTKLNPDFVPSNSVVNRVMSDNPLVRIPYNYEFLYAYKFPHCNIFMIWAEYHSEPVGN